MLTAPMRAAVQDVYDAVGRTGSSSPSGLRVATGRELAVRFGYDRGALAALHPAAAEAFVGAAALEPQVRGASGELVVDLGCGGGLDALLLARRGFRVLALDASAPMLSRLGGARGGPGSPLPVRARLPLIPVRSGSASWALLNGVANLVPERAALLAEVRRVLRPGGRLLAADLFEWGEIPEEVRRLPEAWAWCVGGAASPDRWIADLGRAGFSCAVVEILETIPPLARGTVQATAR